MEAALISLSGHQWPHYYLAMLPAVTALLAFLVRMLADEGLAAPTFLSAALLVATVYYHPPTGSLARVVGRYTSPVSKYASPGEMIRGRYVTAADRIREVSGPDDSILVWGADPQLYVFSHRAAPTRFFYQYPLVLSGYADEELRREFVSGVVQGRPAVIVDAHNRRLPPLDAAQRPEWEAAEAPSGGVRRAEVKYVRDAALFAPLFDLVEREYRLLEHVEGYTLYVRRE